MRQGSVQPLSVTTGLEGRPELGTRGAMVSALVWNTGSGRAAIATLLTLAAATAPPAMPANRKKSLLEFMMVSLRGSVACTSLGSGCTAARDANAGGLANERRLQSGVRQPELLFGVQGRHHRVHLIAGVSKQLENADQHPVVAKLVFFGDGFSQRDHLVAVVARDFIRRAVRGIALAQVRACRATCGLQAVGSGRLISKPRRVAWVFSAASKTESRRTPNSMSVKVVIGFQPCVRAAASYSAFAICRSRRPLDAWRPASDGDSGSLGSVGRRSGNVSCWAWLSSRPISRTSSSRAAVTWCWAVAS